MRIMVELGPVWGRGELPKELHEAIKELLSEARWQVFGTGREVHATVALQDPDPVEEDLQELVDAVGKIRSAGVRFSWVRTMELARLLELMIALENDAQRDGPGETYPTEEEADRLVRDGTGDADYELVSRFPHTAAFISKEFE